METNKNKIRSKVTVEPIIENPRGII